MFKKEGRYKVIGDEGQYEPGSRQRILRNLLGIKKKHEMDQLEFDRLSEIMTKLLDTYEQHHRFTATDICNMHHAWLGDIYSWAGNYRQVNISKGGFQFAAATLIPDLMNKFEQKELRKFTPCTFETLAELTQAIATVHVEFILIHPFREGNGRIARVLANLMAAQAGLPLLNFGGIKGNKRKEYIAAIHAGLERNYEPMAKIFKSVLRKTLQLGRIEKLKQ